MQPSHSCHTPSQYPIQAAYQSLLAATGTNSSQMHSNTQTPDSAGGGTVITSQLIVLYMLHRRVSCSCYAVKMASPSKLLRDYQCRDSKPVSQELPAYHRIACGLALHLLSLFCISEQVMLSISKIWHRDFCAKFVWVFKISLDTPFESMERQHPVQIPLKYQDH